MNRQVSGFVLPAVMLLAFSVSFVLGILIQSILSIDLLWYLAGIIPGLTLSSIGSTVSIRRQSIGILMSLAFFGLAGYALKENPFSVFHSIMAGHSLFFSWNLIVGIRERRSVLSGPAAVFGFSSVLIIWFYPHLPGDILIAGQLGLVLLVYASQRLVQPAASYPSLHDREVLKLIEGERAVQAVITPIATSRPENRNVPEQTEVTGPADTGSASGHWWCASYRLSYGTAYVYLWADDQGLDVSARESIREYGQLWLEKSVSSPDIAAIEDWKALAMQKFRVELPAARCVVFPDGAVSLATSGAVWYRTGVPETRDHFWTENEVVLTAEPADTETPWSSLALQLNQADPVTIAEAATKSGGRGGVLRIPDKMTQVFRYRRELLELKSGGDVVRAGSLATLLLASAPDDALALEVSGRLAGIDDVSRSVEIWKRLAAANPDHPEAAYWSSYASLLDKDYTRARYEAIRAIHLDPTSGQAWNNLGLAEFRLGNYQEAKHALERAHLLNPGSPSILENLLKIRHSGSGK